MNNNQIVNRFPYIIAQRKFPLDAEQLSIELDRSYVDIANALNQRAIGLFAENRPAITGEAWYFQGGLSNRQTLRQVYPFTAAGNIAHNISNNEYEYFTRCYGFFRDNANQYYGAQFSSNVAVAGQVTFYVDATNIVVLSGAGAPTIQDGYIVLEWLTKN